MPQGGTPPTSVVGQRSWHVCPAGPCPVWLHSSVLKHGSPETQPGGQDGWASFPPRWARVLGTSWGKVVVPRWVGEPETIPEGAFEPRMEVGASLEDVQEHPGPRGLCLVFWNILETVGLERVGVAGKGRAEAGCEGWDRSLRSSGAGSPAGCVGQRWLWGGRSGP